MTVDPKAPLPDAPADRVRALLEAVADAYGLEAEVVVEETDERIEARFEGDDLGSLIGRHGATIDALQHLAYRAAHTPGERKAVEVDAAGYRARQAEALFRQADRAAARAVADGVPVPLEPMTSIERKMVHEHLRENHAVETYSEGEEPERRLVVAPVEG